MADDKSGKKDSVKKSTSSNEVDIDRMSIAEGSTVADMKGIDANRYATKKTVAQGLLDIALLTSNASQLKYILQVGPKHEFYTLLVTLISISIILQVLMGFVLLSLNLLHDCCFHKPRFRTSATNINYVTTATAFIITLLVGLLFVVIGGMDLNDQDHQPSAVILNDVIVIFIFVISIINLIISAFGIEYSNNPLVLERLKRLNDEYLRKLNVFSAVGSVILGFIFDINHQPHHRRAEILNNLYLGTKTISTTVNVMISVFYSLDVSANAPSMSVINTSMNAI